MRKRLSAFIFTIVIVAAIIADMSTANAASPSAVEDMDTASCADYAGLPVIEVVLASSSSPGESTNRSALMSTHDTILRRIDELGIDGAIVQVRGTDKIVIDLFHASPVDDKDVNRVIDILKTTGLLEIIDPNGQYLPPGTFVNTTLGNVTTSEADATPISPVYNSVISGRDLAEAFPTTDSLGQVVVGFRLNNSAADMLFSFTSQHLGQPMSIIIDKQVISSPRIDAAISREGIISGISPNMVEDTVILLNSGPLALPLMVVQSSTRSTMCPT